MSVDMFDNADIDNKTDTDRNVKMNPEIKEKWLAALRSGDYKQGQSKLRRILPKLFKRTGGNDLTDERYCCLGILCELYIQDTGKGRWIMDDFDGEFKFDDGNGSSSYGMPTNAVYAWAGMSNDDGFYVDNKDFKAYKVEDSSSPYFGLAALNDGGRRFPTIAKLIEKYL